jgi:hypothetical protein
MILLIRLLNGGPYILFWSVRLLSDTTVRHFGDVLDQWIDHLSLISLPIKQPFFGGGVLDQSNGISGTLADSTPHDHEHVNMILF